MNINLGFAVQWFHNGDFPGEDPNVEGTVVRYFRHPDFPGETRSPVNGERFHDHGWIDVGQFGKIIAPGQIIYSFMPYDLFMKDPQRNLNSLGNMDAEAFKQIFGMEELFKAQRLNQSFARGDTTQEIFLRHLRQDIIPSFRNDFAMKLIAMGSSESIEIPDVENEFRNSIGYNVGVLNLMITDFWQKAHRTGRKSSAIEIWYTQQYVLTQEKLDKFGHGLKLLGRDDYDTELRKSRV